MGGGGNKRISLDIFSRSGSADWIHTQLFHKPVKCFSSPQKTVSFPHHHHQVSGRRPYLICFMQRCFLWWISYVRELENYYLDLAVWLPSTTRVHHLLLLSRFTFPSCAALGFLTKLLKKPNLLKFFLWIHLKCGLLVSKTRASLLKRERMKDHLWCMWAQPLWQPHITMDTVFKAGAYLDNNTLAWSMKLLLFW